MDSSFEKSPTIRGVDDVFFFFFFPFLRRRRRRRAAFLSLEERVLLELLEEDVSEDEVELSLSEPELSDDEARYFEMPRREDLR